MAVLLGLFQKTSTTWTVKMSDDFVCNMAEFCSQVKCLHHKPHEHVSVSDTGFCTDEYGYCDIVEKAVICVHANEVCDD